MRRIYHVADPEFWKKFGGPGSVKQIPHIGDRSLEVTVRGESFTLAGGFIKSIRCVKLQEPMVVEVEVTNSPVLFELTIPKGYWSECPNTNKDRYSSLILRDSRIREGNLEVCYVFDWMMPHDVRITVYDENPKNGGFNANFWSGAMSIEQLEGALAKRQKPPIKLPVSDLIMPGKPRQKEGELVLPAEVTFGHLKNAAKELLHFAQFARKQRA